MIPSVVVVVVDRSLLQVVRVDSVDLGFATTVVDGRKTSQMDMRKHLISVNDEADAPATWKFAKVVENMGDVEKMGKGGIADERQGGLLAGRVVADVEAVDY